MVFKTALVVLSASAMLAQTTAAAPLGEKQKAELLKAQNRYRAELSETALVWSDGLAKTAQRWAEHLARDVHAIKHSGAIATGESIAATWPPGSNSLTRMVDVWGAEKQYFVDAAFPAVSRTGDSKDVVHYSQLVWRKTTEVGCGLASGGGQDYLVCQYSPEGNFAGDKPF